MTKAYHTWCRAFVVTIAVVVALTVAVNYLFDPLWCFNHVTRINRYSYLMDPRQQKTNRFTFDTSGYDALLLGSSRADLISPKELKGCHAFNYAVSAMLPVEYVQYLRYAQGKSRLKRVFIGLDFFSTTKQIEKANLNALSCIRTANERWYRFKMLFSLDAVVKLIKYRFFEKQVCYYDRADSVVSPCSVSKEDADKIFLDRYNKIRVFYDSTAYAYNGDVGKIYREIKAVSPDAEIIVFITPETQALYEYMIKQGRFADYRRWLEDLVEVFGGVYNFMYLNSVTTDRNNFIDADHFYPRIGTMIAHKVTGAADPHLPPDFGVYVTRENLAGHLSMLEKQAERIERR